MENMAVSMRGITKAFNGVKANDAVDFDLKKGSIHGLLGENGAGKTTLMNILYGLYQQDEGTVMINDKAEQKAGRQNRWLSRLTLSPTRTLVTRSPIAATRPAPS